MALAVQLTDILYRWRKGRAVVIDIPDFSVASGEKLFISGPSGSGKTTLLNLLGGVAVPERGEVTVLGDRLDRMPARRRDTFRADRIGFVFQQYNLVPYLSVIDNVLLPCRFSERRRERAADVSNDAACAARRLLDRMNLPVDELIARSVTELSAGQQQRVAAARALIGRPDLVIADEPTSSLDEGVRRAFLELLFAEVNESDQTLIFVSHDGRLADAFDRAVTLEDVNRVAVPAAV